MNLLRSSFGFSGGNGVGVKFASYGNDHLCLIFFKNGVRVSSFCAEAPGKCDYLSEKDGEAKPVGGLDEALKLAEQE